MAHRDPCVLLDSSFFNCFDLIGCEVRERWNLKSLLDTRLFGRGTIGLKSVNSLKEGRISNARNDNDSLLQKPFGQDVAWLSSLSGILRESSCDSLQDGVHRSRWCFGDGDKTSV
jgi:hypothetical protein